VAVVATKISHNTVSQALNDVRGRGVLGGVKLDKVRGECGINMVHRGNVRYIRTLRLMFKFRIDFLLINSEFGSFTSLPSSVNNKITTRT